MKSVDRLDNSNKVIESLCSFNVQASGYDLVGFNGEGEPNVEEVVVADVDSGEVLEGRDFNPFLIGELSGSNQIAPLSILDDRGLTFLSNVEPAPFCKIVMLRMGVDKNGDGISDYLSDRTGFLVGPGVILTAGHCLYSNSSTIVSIEAYTKWNGNSYGSKAMAKSWYVPNSYYENPEQVDSDYDWGIVEMNCNLAEKVAWGIHTHGGTTSNYGTRFDINLYGILKQKIYNDIQKYY